MVAVHAEMREAAAGVRVCGDAAGLAGEPRGASGALDSADDDEVDCVCGREGDTEGDEQKGGSQEERRHGMLSKEEMGELARRKQPCPYGRGCTVGSLECENCKFNRVEGLTKHTVGSDTLASRCEGNTQAVEMHLKHLRRMGLEPSARASIKRELQTNR